MLVGPLVSFPLSVVGFYTPLKKKYLESEEKYFDE